MNRQMSIGITDDPVNPVVSSATVQPESVVVISVQNVGKMYRLYDRPQDRLKEQLFWRFGKHFGREFWALRDVSFEVRRGETVGIVGRNGSGKSTLLQIVSGTLAPTLGEVKLSGRVAALLELGSGFNPEFTGRENVFLNGSILGIDPEEMAFRYSEIVAFADIGDFIDQPVKLYSSGMVVRLAFAVQACIHPDILIVDEALAVGDASFQRKCYQRLDDLRDRGASILFVSHDINAVTNLCTRAILLEAGQVISHGSALQVCDLYQKRLFSSEINGLLQEYGDGTAEFTNIWFEGADGTAITTLSSGAEFYFCYQVHFRQPSSEPVFGLRVRNIQGVALVSTNTYLMGRRTGHYEADESVTVKWQLRLPLAPGYYFFSCGCSYADTDQFMCRKVDAVKMLMTGLFRSAGILDSVEDIHLQR